MKKVFAFIEIIFFALCMFGCGSKPVKAPNTPDHYVGMARETATEEFAQAGFENVKMQEVKDIDMYNSDALDTVASISIDSATDFSVDTEYNKDAEVIITYHAPAVFDANIHINFIGNILFSKYDVDLIIDDENIATMEHGEDQDLQVEMEFGQHEVKFAKSNDSSIETKFTLDAKCRFDASYTISCESDRIKVTENFIDYDLKLEEGQIKTTTSWTDFYYKNYDEVVTALTEMGFTNITTEPIYDIVYGVTEDGSVDSITVDGKDGFERGEVYAHDASVVKKYHTFEENDPEVIAAKQKEEEERKAEEARKAEEEKKAEEEREAEEARLAEEEARLAEEANKTLTVDNCEELAQILSMNASSDPAYVNFASKYAGCKIEFDGRIDYCVHHGSYKTRFDYLVSAGDYDPDHQIGPTFKFEDVNYFDLHTDLESVEVGMNVHIIAYVEEFDSEHELFYLDPVAVTGR